MGLEELLSGEANMPQPPIGLALARLAANRPLRLFVAAITGMSKAQLREFAADFRVLFNVAQSDIMVTKDSRLIDELRKYPHFVALFDRLSEL
jgi:hypothetical protein